MSQTPTPLVRCLLLVLVTTILPRGDAEAQQTARVADLFASDGSVVRVNLTTNIVGPAESIWSGAAPALSPLSRQGFSVAQVVDDPAHHRAFLLLGLRQTSRQFGYLVYDTAARRLIARLVFESEADTSDLVVSPDGRGIYVSYVEPVDESPSTALAVTRTAVFDGESYQRTDDAPDSPLGVGPGACFVNDRVLYSPHHFIDVSQKKVLRRGGLFGQPMTPIDCRRNRLLLLSVSKEMIATLTVRDTTADRTVSSVATGIKVDGIVVREWALTGDGRRIIRDELVRVAVGGGSMSRSSGRLTVWSADSGRREGDVAIRISDDTFNGLIGSSSDGALAFYRSKSRLSIVDLARVSVIRELELPLVAIGIAAP